MRDFKVNADYPTKFVAAPGSVTTTGQFTPADKTGTLLLTFTAASFLVAPGALAVALVAPYALFCAWIAATAGEWVSSDLARTELMRAVRRGAPDLLVQARAVLDSVTVRSNPR